MPPWCVDPTLLQELEFSEKKGQASDSKTVDERSYMMLDALLPEMRQALSDLLQLLKLQFLKCFLGTRNWSL